MFEDSTTRKSFLKALNSQNNLRFEDLVEFQEYQQKVDFFSISDSEKGFNPTRKLPIIKEILSKTMDVLSKCRKGETVAVEGYLEQLQSTKALDEAIWRFVNKNNVETDGGFKTYTFYAEASKIPIDVIVLAPLGIGVDLTPNLPYTIKILLLGRTDYKTIFLLKDEPESTTLKIPTSEVPFPVLTLKELRKGLADVSSLSTGDKHIADSLISPFVGSDLFNKKSLVDGIGSSFIQNTGLEKDVNRLNNILMTSSYGLSLEHFGVLNVTSSGLAEQIDRLRTSPQALQKLKVLSWNIPTSKDINNLKLSEFKYKSEAINLESERDIQNNIALQHSLAYYSILKSKVVPQYTYGESLKKAIDYISSLKEGGDIVFEQIIDENKLPVQIGRIASFYTAFGSRDIAKLTEKVIEEGVDSTAQDVVYSTHKRPVEKELAKGVPHGVWSAIFASDRTKNGIVEKLMDKFGWSEKRAEEQLTHLHEEGQLICPDGVHYKLLNESRFNFSYG